MTDTSVAPLGSQATSRTPSWLPRMGAALAALGLGLSACSTTAGPTAGPTGAPSTATGNPSPAATHEGRVVVYSGRSEALVDPVLKQFQTTTGIKVEIRYAGTSELAATILEESGKSPADVFFSQDAGALGALAAAQRLAKLPDDVLALVDPRFRAASGLWVGISGRARVLAYDKREMTEAGLPARVQDLATSQWKGRVGWLPTNASFQTFVTAMRRAIGDSATADWLKAMQANQPRVYSGNAAALQAVAAGEIDVALINHYYLFQAQAESGKELPVANHYFKGGDPGALVNIAGAGILGSAPHPVAASQLVRFLLGQEAQRYFSDKTYEYPLVKGITADPRLPALSSIQSPDFDLSDLADLKGSLRLLQEAGVL